MFTSSLMRFDLFVFVFFGRIDMIYCTFYFIKCFFFLVSSFKRKRYRMGIDIGCYSGFQYGYRKRKSGIVLSLLKISDGGLEG